MRITDPKWPAVREISRTVLREDAIVIEGPLWLRDEVHSLSVLIGDKQPARLVFPAYRETVEQVLRLRHGIENRLLCECSLTEPSIDVVWCPLHPNDAWPVLWQTLDDLISAGYPGCLGCAGPEAEEPWDENLRRETMLKAVKDQP